jgi:hypothetical protein
MPIPVHKGEVKAFYVRRIQKIIEDGEKAKDGEDSSDEPTGG